MVKQSEIQMDQVKKGMLNTNNLNSKSTQSKDFINPQVSPRAPMDHIDASQFMYNTLVIDENQKQD